MATRDDAREALLKQIVEITPEMKQPSSLLKLAEAYAWVMSPGHSHGGGDSSA